MVMVVRSGLQISVGRSRAHQSSSRCWERSIAVDYERKERVLTSFLAPESGRELGTETNVGIWRQMSVS